jgi:hypothetical protein
VSNYVPDGCFLLARIIFDSAIWRDDPHVLKLFIYLIGKARHNKEPKQYPGFKIKRGELVTSLSQISEDNEFYNRTVKKWSRAKVSRMLALLKEQGYIDILADTYGTHISICNYDRFQDLDNYKTDSNETQVKRKRNASETQVSINNKDKNDNNDKKEYTPPTPPRGEVLAGRFDVFWEAYPKKKSKGQAEKAWKKIKPSKQLLADIIAKIEEAKTSVEWQREGGQYIPYPATWLNAKGWEDEYTQGSEYRQPQPPEREKLN